jgi:NADH dehydrogenase [ubiquinone] 1 alpha subcomplex assembly factor 6
LRGLFGRTTSHRDRRSPAAGAPAGKLSAAAELVRHHDRDRYQTALFAPAARREALFALYAFNYEVARVRETVREPALGLIRLEWWREAIAAAYDGGPVRRHAIVEPLTETIRRARPTRAHFERLIEARERDLDDAPQASLAALEDYAEGSSGRLVMLALELLEVREAAVIQAAGQVGIGYALAGMLRAMRYFAATGRSVIPADIARRTGLDEGDYRARRGTPAIRAAAAEIAAAARHHLQSARARRADIPPGAMPALLPAVVADRSLARLAKVRYDPFAPDLARPDPLQSWRLAVAAFRRRF